jgi:sulfatase modifying factor 1
MGGIWGEGLGQEGDSRASAIEQRCNGLLHEVDVTKGEKQRARADGVPAPAPEEGYYPLRAVEAHIVELIAWQEAYAFCIWGGFLPSEAEWEYAAAGGSQQREYPWGTAALGTACPGTGCQYAIYNCDYPSGTGNCTGVVNIAPVGYAAAGAGLWGQLDLAGEMWAWNLDWFATYADPCTDCANLTAPLTAASGRVVRGGDLVDTWSNLLPPARANAASGTQADRGFDIGFRCSRTP